MEINQMIKLIANQNRINQLIDSITRYNNQSEYLRIKYYNVMLHDLRLLNQYIKGIWNEWFYWKWKCIIDWR